MISTLAQQLKATGEFDQTEFVFTSDNGNSYGAHRLVNKQVPYEETIRVPLSIAGPGVRHADEGALVTHLDYTPTVLDLAGLGAAPELDGRSLVPLLHAAGAPWRNDFLIEYHGTYGIYYNVNTMDDVRYYTDQGLDLLGPPTYRAVRNESYLYVEWYAGDEHEYELYDLAADPFELDNLLATDAGRTANATLVAQLQARLEALGSCTGPTCRS